MIHVANTTAVKRLAVAGVVIAGLSGAFSPALRVGAQPITNTGDGSSAGDTPSDGSDANGATKSTGGAITSSEVGTRAVGTITGQGTTGRIPKFTGTNAIGNSVMFESSGNIGIGTTSPGFLLTVNGTGAAVVRGINNGTANGNTGVHGSAGGTGWGVYGFSPSGRGLFAQSTAGYDVFATSSSGYGLFASHAAASGTNPGVQGETNSTAASANGVVGRVVPTGPGANSAGVRGINNGTNSNGMGVYGSHAGGGDGVYGTSTNGNGVHGSNSGSNSFAAGVYGQSSTTDGTGVLGEANTGTQAFGVWGKSTTGEAGHFTARSSLTAIWMCWATSPRTAARSRWIILSIRPINICRTPSSSRRT